MGCGSGLKNSPSSMQQIIYGQQKSKEGGEHTKNAKERKSKLGHVPPVDRHNSQTMQPPLPSCCHHPHLPQHSPEKEDEHNWNGGWKLQCGSESETFQPHGGTHPPTHTHPHAHPTRTVSIPDTHLRCPARRAFHFNLNSIFLFESSLLFFLLASQSEQSDGGQLDNWFERICVFASNNCKLFSLRVPL